MEVCVDDILVKSQAFGGPCHQPSRNLYYSLQISNEVNRTKCAFGVTSEKFFGFMVSRKGIETNPEKIKAKWEMSPLRSIKEVQRLMKKVATPNRFVSRSVECYLSFFKILKQPTDFKWIEESQQKFEEWKSYLNSPPLLTKLEPSEELCLYLMVSPAAISSVLIHQEGKLQKPIYYISRTLYDAEIRYTRLEKMIYTLIILVRKLWPYFQAHTIGLLIDQPLKSILYQPDTTSRVAK